MASGFTHSEVRKSIDLVITNLTVKDLDAIEVALNSGNSGYSPRNTDPTDHRNSSIPMIDKDQQNTISNLRTLVAKARGQLTKA